MTLMIPKPKPKKKGVTRFDKAGHEFLYGAMAHFWRRKQIFERAGGTLNVKSDEDGASIEAIQMSPAMCEICHKPVGWATGHWVHKERRHCDCMGCALFAHWECHDKTFHHGSKGYR